MSQSKRPIPMPWQVRLLQFRRRWLPAILFICCLAITVWLWQRQQLRATVRGQVEAVRVDVTAPADGMLEMLPNQVDVFDPVVANATVVAQVDAAPLRAEIEVIRAEQAALEAQLAAERDRLLMEKRRFALDEQRNVADQRRQASQLRQEMVEYQMLRDELQLQRIEAFSEQAIAKHEKKRVQDRIVHTTVLVDREMASTFALQDAVNEKAVFDSQIAELAKELAALDRQIDEAATRAADAEQRLEEALAELEASDSHADAALELRIDRTLDNLEVLLRPIERAIKVEESRIREVVQRMDNLEIRAPVSGTITAVYLKPGTWVRMGEPILSITKHQADHITVYLPSGDRRRIEPHMNVDVIVGVQQQRSRHAAKVSKVGTNFEPIPLHYLGRDPTPEWGLPIQIALPEDIAVRPGEFVEVVFPPSGDAA